MPTGQQQHRQQQPRRSADQADRVPGPPGATAYEIDTGDASSGTGLSLGQCPPQAAACAGDQNAAKGLHGSTSANSPVRHEPQSFLLFAPPLVKFRRLSTSYALIEDNSRRSEAQSVVDAQVGYDLYKNTVLRLDVFNLLDASTNDISYYTSSRCCDRVE